MATSGSITCDLLDEFFEFSYRELQYYLQQRELPTLRTHETLVATGLTAHEQKIECFATVAH